MFRIYIEIIPQTSVVSEVLAALLEDWILLPGQNQCTGTRLCGIQEASRGLQGGPHVAFRGLSLSPVVSRGIPFLLFTRKFKLKLLQRQRPKFEFFILLASINHYSYDLPKFGTCEQTILFIPSFENWPRMLSNVEFLIFRAIKTFEYVHIYRLR